MQGHRRRRETKRSTATPVLPKGWGGTGPSFCCFSSPMSLHRLVVAPRSGLRRAPHKRRRIYESEYLVRLLLRAGFQIGLQQFDALAGEICVFAYRIQIQIALPVCTGRVP